MRKHIADQAESVTAAELDEIKHDRERMARLRAELGVLAIDLHARERDVIRRIEAGAAIEGTAVVLTRRRQSISWLTVVADELGPETVQKVKDAWPIAFWKELQIA